MDEHTLDPGGGKVFQAKLTDQQRDYIRADGYPVQFGCAKCGRQFVGRIGLSGGTVAADCACGERLSLTFKGRLSVPESQGPDYRKGYKVLRVLFGWKCGVLTDQ